MYDVHIYVLHCAENCAARKPMCTKLAEALKSASTFKAHVEYVMEFDPQQLIGMGPNIASMVDVNPEAVREHPDLAQSVRTLHVNQLSCALKHSVALSRIAASASRGSYGFHIVVEDDALFTDDICKQLHRVLMSVPTDYDVVFLGLPAPNDVAASMKSGALKEPHFASLASAFPMPPSCEAYLVNPHAAMRMSSVFAPIRLSANLQLAWAIRRNALKGYFAVPNVFVDGSKLGVYVSQQDPNNRLMWNDQFAKLEALVNGPLPSTPAELKAAQDFVDTLQFRTHPDILRLLGRLQVRLKNYKEAEVIFGQVYAILVGEKCVINSQSQFLADYMSLYRHLQSDCAA
jgi:GR25 family glycosyltransferase involved in LPS biosynthesis